MKDFALKVLQSITAAAIIGTATILYSFNARLSRIETRLETIAPRSVTAPAASQPGASQLTAKTP